MNILKGIVFIVFLFCWIEVSCGEWNESPNFNKEDLLENLIETPSLEESEDFKTLGYLNDEMLIEMKVDLTNHRRSILTQVAEIIEKYIPQNPPNDKQIEVCNMARVVQRCSDIENNIWLIIKIRRLHDQRVQNENRLAEKPHKLQ